MDFQRKVQKATEASEPPPKRFKRTQKHSVVSETDNTDDDEVVGGMGVFSHGSKSLVHQHWVDQVISAGGFNVHCTQAAEASHKINMHLASCRVRHHDSNSTQHAMLQYLLLYSFFEEMKINIIAPTYQRIRRPGFRVPLDIGMTRMESTAFQSTFLHREVRVAGVELNNLLCDKLRLPKSTISYQSLQHLHIQFSQNWIQCDGKSFWGTDSAYNQGARRARRDILRLRGTIDGNALCCETVCFLKISNARALGYPDDDLSLVLVRWLEPHPEARERDDDKLPVCPGPLHINNCLWSYAKSSQARRSLVALSGRPSRAFANQKLLFAATRPEQRLCWEREKHAYYGLVQTDNILHTENMCTIFEPNSAKPRYGVWLHTVRMC